MKDKMIVAQLRGSIFAPLFIGYTPENCEHFKDLLLRDSKVYNASVSPIIPGVDPNLPQYGMPWRLFKKLDEGKDLNIVFQQGKVDIILTTDSVYGGDLERQFCDRCIEMFSKILESHGAIKVNRIAYAPLYAIRLGDSPSSSFWNRLLKGMAFEGSQMKDVNLNYNFKKEIEFNETKIQMNLLHNFNDGVQIVKKGDEINNLNVVLMQLDLNSIPGIPLELDMNGIRNFYNGILDVKNKLVDNVWL